MHPELKIDTVVNPSTNRYRSFLSLEDGSDSPALVAGKWQEVIMLHVDITLTHGVEQLDLVSTEDGCEGEVEFCLCETVCTNS